MCLSTAVFGVRGMLKVLQQHHADDNRHAMHGVTALTPSIVARAAHRIEVNRYVALTAGMRSAVRSPLDHVVDVGEVARTVAVVVDLDRLAGEAIPPTYKRLVASKRRRTVLSGQKKPACRPSPTSIVAAQVRPALRV